MLGYKFKRNFYKVYKFRDRKSKKRGRPKTYSDKEIIVILLIMEVKKIHTLFGIVRFLNNNKNLLKLIGITTSPSRKTIRKRNKKLSSKLRYIIRKIGKDLAVHFGIDFKIASTDTTMFKSAGPLWHKKDRKLNSIPRKLRNVDKESKWGYSPTKGWIQGYKGDLSRGSGLMVSHEALMAVLQLADKMKRLAKGFIRSNRFFTYSKTSSLVFRSFVSKALIPPVMINWS